MIVISSWEDLFGIQIHGTWFEEIEQKCSEETRQNVQIH